MLFHIFVAVFFFGFALLLGILGVMRGFYRTRIFQPPDIPDDSIARVATDDYRKQSNPGHDEIGDPWHW